MPSNQHESEWLIYKVTYILQTYADCGEVEFIAYLTEQI